MNKVYISKLIPVKSTQKLKSWPKVAVKISKVVILAKAGEETI
jgi:hypothetical protein